VAIDWIACWRGVDMSWLLFEGCQNKRRSKQFDRLTVD
jgi:hypothetical protein